jgi:polysaccharide export outer membrane protein
MAQRPEYLVEPPDLILVEVLEALPGRPISGERLVRPDGRISLGFYGEISVAGLTTPQIKERIVLHLRRFISDDLLGLIDSDPETGDLRRDPSGRLVIKDPRETDRVFVDVTAYNSHHCYVLGEVNLPGSLPYTGGDTVLDLLQYAGGLLPSADKGRIRLIRSFPKGSPARVLPVDYDEIAMGTDSSTNYPILPNDRLVIPRAASSGPEVGADRGASSGENPAQDARATRASAARISSNVEGRLHFDRNTHVAAQNPGADLEKRIDELEKKLDRLIEVMEKAQPMPAVEPEERPAADTGDRPPSRAESGRGEAMELPPARGMGEPTRRSGPGPRSRPRPRRPGPMGPRPPADQRPRRDEPGGSPPESRATRPGIPDLPAPRSDVLPPQSPPER